MRQRNTQCARVFFMLAAVTTLIWIATTPHWEYHEIVVLLTLGVVSLFAAAISLLRYPTGFSSNRKTASVVSKKHPDH